MKSVLKDGRGQHSKRIAAKNKKKVELWFHKNPGTTKKECQDATGLSALTVRQHINALIKEGRFE